MRFVDWLIASLHGAGTRFAFGVPGGGASLDLMAAARAGGIQPIICAREDAAVMMAGVAGMLAGAPGLAFTTKGPGVSSASNGLACADLDRLPALLISETFGADEVAYLSHQVFDQAALVAPLTRRLGAGVLPAAAAPLAAWLRSAPSPPRGPAVMFASAADYGLEVAARPDLSAGSQPSPDQTEVASAAARLAGARRPVLIFGLEAARALGTGAAGRLAAALQVPGLCTYMAKGTLADSDPHWAGIFTGGAIEQACVGEADLIVTIGLDPVELIRKPWPYAAPVLEICERVHRPHYFTAAQRLVGPLDALLDAVMGALGSRPPGGAWPDGAIAAHRTAFLDGMRVRAGKGLDASTLVSAVAEAFAGPRPPRLAVDAGAHMFSACAFWPCQAPLDLLISNGLATMGFALPAALAAAVHEPQRGAVAMTGDGGLLMCLGELKTAAEMGARLCVVVFNDARLSLIDIKREDRQMPDLGMSWRAPNFAAVAEGFGIPGWRVTSREDLGDALRRATALDGPCLIDARVDSAGYREQLTRLRG